MRIAVTTPQGHVGRHLTAMLVRAGQRPVVLSRHPDTLPHEVTAHADVRRADSRDAAEVVDATRGVDAVYWVDPPAASAEPLRDYRSATAAICAAVQANGIRRVVFQSSVGAEKRHGCGEIDGLADTEVALDRLGIDVTHLRCGYLCTNLLLDLPAVRDGLLRTVTPLDHPVAWVAPRDVAARALALLRDEGWRGRRVRAVHGPQDLTWAQVVQVLSEETGRQVRVERVSDTEMTERYRAAGMPPAVVDAVLGMATGTRDDFVPEQPRTAWSTTPTTLREWVRAELVPAL